LTYRGIKAHLEEKYSTRKCYWGAAQIVSRRARKRFNVKLNVDTKWSSSM
jgi:hypothetical protein